MFKKKKKEKRTSNLGAPLLSTALYIPLSLMTIIPYWVLVVTTSHFCVRLCDSSSSLGSRPEQTAAASLWRWSRCRCVLWVRILRVQRFNAHPQSYPTPTSSVHLCTIHHPDRGNRSPANQHRSRMTASSRQPETAIRHRNK